MIGQPRLLRVAHALRLLGERVVVSAHRPRRGDLGHAVLEDHRARDLRDALEVVGGAVRDPSEDDLLRGPAGEEHHHQVDELLARVQVAVLGRHVSVYPSACPRETMVAFCAGKSSPTRWDMTRVPGLVEREDALLLVGDDTPLLEPGDDALHRGLEVGVPDVLRAVCGRR